MTHPPTAPPTDNAGGTLSGGTVDGGTVDGDDGDPAALIPLRGDLPETEVSPSRRRHRRGLAITAALTAVALIAGGVLLGWSLASRAQEVQTADDAVLADASVPSAVSEGPAALLMPDVRGLDENAAREVLADQGLSPAIVTTSDRPAAGPSGIVIEQTPAFGTSDPQSVSLVLSAAATVPAIDGRPGEDVVRELSVLGAQVVVQQRYVAGGVAGAAVQIDPAVGSPLPDVVTLVVTEPASSVYLSQLSPVEGRCSSDRYLVNGVDYEQGLSCPSSPSGSARPQRVAWVTSKAVDSVIGTVGVADTADPGAVVRVDVYADGTLASTSTAGYGAPVDFQASTSGSLRITIVVTDLSPAAGSSFSGAEAVLGDVRLVGGSAAMQKLAGQ